MKNKIPVFVSAAILAVLAGGVPSGAQDPPPAAGRAARVQENLITFKLMRMTQVLALTEDQTAKIFPALTRMEREKFDISKRLNERMRALRELIRTDRPDETRMTAAIEDIAALRLEIRNKDHEADRFLRGQLNVRQYARYTLFLVDFNRGLEEKLHRARMMRDAPPSGRGTESREPDIPL